MSHGQLMAVANLCRVAVDIQYCTALLPIIAGYQLPGTSYFPEFQKTGASRCGVEI